MQSYTYHTITINEKIIDIAKILSNNITPKSEFEHHTFTFIRDWLKGVDQFVIHTSGSTGTPKQIVITRSQMEYSARMTLQALNIEKNSTALICLNTNYIGGKMMLARALINNMNIIAIEPSANPLHKVTQSFNFIALVPLQLETILNSTDQYKLEKADAVIIGGAAVGADLIKKIKLLKSPAYATYGMTETISHIALQRLNGAHDEIYFKTLPGIKIQTDERECLVITAPYLNEKIYTNDLVKIIDTETFRWLGRWDNIINTGGVKVVPEIIESKIKNLNAYKNINQNFFICGTTDALLGEKVILIIEGEILQSWNNILLSLKQSCSKYELPKEVRTVSKFNYTHNGKIDRKITANNSHGISF